MEPDILNPTSRQEARGLSYTRSLASEMSELEEVDKDVLTFFFFSFVEGLGRAIGG
jgi:hypothetical protein